MLVFVLNKFKEPLMPCKPCKARKLLKQGKAKMVKKTPFTIQLLYGSTDYKQDIIAGLDTGSKVIGSVAISNGKVLYQSEIHLRNDISKKLGKKGRRSVYRRNRRVRKLRYREKRYNNRGNSIKSGRITPSLRSKIESHLKERKFVESILPVTNWILELASFDIHKISNPSVSKKYGWTYQKGELKGYYNIKAFVLNRDNYICQYCKGKEKDKRLETHHIIWRSNGGADHQDNMIILCKTCHDKIHKKIIILKKKGKISNTKHATQMGIIKSQLKKQFGEFKETFGYETKYKREQILKLPKSHSNDAISICCAEGEIVKPLDNILIKKCVSKGDYQQTKGKRSEKKIPTGKLFGFRKFDKIEYLNNIYFIKGRMSTGYVILSDVLGNKINLKPIPKFIKMKRINGRKSWIIDQKIIVNKVTCN